MDSGTLCTFCASNFKATFFGLLGKFSPTSAICASILPTPNLQLLRNSGGRIRVWAFLIFTINQAVEFIRYHGTNLGSFSNYYFSDDNVGLRINTSDQNEYCIGCKEPEMVAELLRSAAGLE